MKAPDKNTYTPGDHLNYAEILHQTNAIKHNNDSKSNKQKPSKGLKYREIIKRICDMVYSGIRPHIGERIGTTLIPSDPHALIERFDLLMASKEAGNTGVRNEKHMR